MAYIITLISDGVKSGKTTIAFNLAAILSNKNKKVLLISPEHAPSYLALLTDENKTKTKNIIHPFNLMNYDKWLSILLLFINKNSNNKYDYVKLLTKQLQLLEAKYDLIIVDTNYLSNALTKLSLINSQKIIAVCDSNNFSSGQLQKILTFVRKNQTDNPSLKLSTIILNNYNPDIHIDPLLNIAKMVGTNCLFITLPFRSELQKIDQQSVKFIKNNQWDDYTLMLNKVVKQLMKDI